MSSLLDALDTGIVVKFGSDISGLIKGAGDASTALEKFGSSSDKSTVSYTKLGVAAATVATSTGLAIVGLTDAAKETNATLAGTAITLGTTTEDMRNLALATSDAGFPLDDTISTFDLLARAGVRGDDQLQSIAKSMDTLGDATGNSAATVTSALIPALNAFDIPLSQVGEHVDGLTYLTKNSTIELTDFTGTMSVLGPKLNDLGLSLEDSEAIMLALSKAGYQGTAATRLFRSAVSDSKGDVNALYASLGLTKETVEGYKTEIDNATGSTEKYAAAADSAIGTTDQIKSALDEFTLSIGSSLEPLSGVGTVLSVGGPLILGLTQLPELIGGVSTAMTFLAANPIVLIIAAVALLVLGLYELEVKFHWIETVTAAFGAGWAILWTGMVSAVQGAADLITGIINTLVSGVKWGINLIIDGVNTLISGINTVSSVGGLLGNTFRIPSVPRLASGGIVTSPQVVMAGEGGEPEAIVPLSKAGSMGFGDGGITFTGNTFNVREEADIGKVAKQLYTLIEQGKRSRGTS
jgi:hypothetical protein